MTRNSHICVRAEQEADIEAISSVVKLAFLGHPFSNQQEACIVEGLRRDGHLSVSLVATQDEVIGHVAFSPVTVNGASGWYGLGPIAVKPDLQRSGIGKALIESGLRELANLNAKGCVVLGDPQYYQKFGFTRIPGLRFNGAPPEYFMALSMTNTYPDGEVVYAPAFYRGASHV